MENYLANDDRTSGLPRLLDKLECKIVAEIGVREGFLSDHILSHSKVEKYYAIDNNHQYNYVRHIKDKYWDRFIIIEGTSPDCANNYYDDFFDFIYIDAGHSYKAVKADLNGWWPKLKIGGLFIGDDYWPDHPNRDEPDGYGVMSAVNEFMQENKQNLFISGCDKGPNDFVEFLKWAQYNLDEVRKNNKGESNRFKQNPQWFCIKQNSAELI